MDSLDDELLALVEGPCKRKRILNETEKPGWKLNESLQSFRNHDLYPVDGLYSNKEDKQTLWRMTELQREMILAERAEEIQKVIDARALSSMVAHCQSVGSVLLANRISTPELSQDNDPAPIPESPGNAYPTPTESPPTPEAFQEPISSLSAPTPRSTLHEHTLHSNHSPAPLFARSPTPEVYPDASLSDLERCRLSRRLVLRFFKMTWFGKYIQGMWVRCQTSPGRYEISQVNALSKGTVQPYKINGVICNCTIKLVCGSVIRHIALDLISNGAFTKEEFTIYKEFTSRDDIPSQQRMTSESKLK
ncbi:hypothetical protein BDP27DRAFT_1429443 [Rhodocollybia butyracea]|uniref:Plus3 domain-containing protein n=1 Tax=Rhodocollybia butyracea TaxID=206335 RepID=A0A9P5U026_9AGAR|nr:hypothetical protein BDP27DRAFT_1429443 [Rhodocollybia butyracea]